MTDIEVKSYSMRLENDPERAMQETGTNALPVAVRGTYNNYIVEIHHCRSNLLRRIQKGMHETRQSG